MLNEKKYMNDQAIIKNAPTLWHVNDLITDYNRTSSGHFFDTDTMSFFKSKVIEFFRGNGDQAYFITSERFDNNTPRFYSIRLVERVKAKNFWGYKYSIDTVDNFQGFKTSNAAKKAIEKILKGNK